MLSAKTPAQRVAAAWAGQIQQAIVIKLRLATIRTQVTPAQSSDWFNLGWSQLELDRWAIIFHRKV